MKTLTVFILIDMLNFQYKNSNNKHFIIDKFHWKISTNVYGVNMIQTLMNISI